MNYWDQFLTSELQSKHMKIIFHKEKLNYLYTSEPTILYFAIFSTTRFTDKINLLEKLLELSGTPWNSETLHSLTCTMRKKKKWALNIISCFWINNKVKTTALPFNVESTYRWHSPACRIKSSLFLALMVNSCSVELKTSRSRWHCRVLFRCEEKRIAQFQVTHHRTIMNISKFLYVNTYE